ncbi:MAG: hypothetical protein ACI89W_001129 [Gammaproteobacteria bacterium]|jgi:hypothetical protein
MTLCYLQLAIREIAGESAIAGMLRSFEYQSC